MVKHLRINSKMRVWTSRAREQESGYGKSDLSQDLNFQEILQVRARQYNASQSQAEFHKWGRYRVQESGSVRKAYLGPGRVHLKSGQAGGQQRHKKLAQQLDKQKPGNI